VILFDSHCHLTDRSYIVSLDDVISRAQNNGVQFMLTVGLNIDDSLVSIKIANKYPDVYCSIGIHPHDAKGMRDGDMDRLEKMISDSKVKAIGETGLDFYRNYSDRASQEKAFHNQIDLAQKLGMPMIIHIRAAYPEAKTILLEHKYFNGVIHCYSGDDIFAQWAIAQGFYISFTGSITYDNPNLKDIAKILPQDRILIETDAPYLAPVPMRGKRNEPSYVKYVAQTIAQLRNSTVENICEQTTKNSKKIFSI
jgi:TatD DNase family protein